MKQLTISRVSKFLVDMALIETGSWRIQETRDGRGSVHEITNRGLTIGRHADADIIVHVSSTSDMKENSVMFYTGFSQGLLISITLASNGTPSTSAFRYETWIQWMEWVICGGHDRPVMSLYFYLQTFVNKKLLRGESRLLNDGDALRFGYGACVVWSYDIIAHILARLGQIMWLIRSTDMQQSFRVEKAKLPPPVSQTQATAGTQTSLQHNVTPPLAPSMAQVTTSSSATDDCRSH